MRYICWRSTNQTNELSSSIITR